MTAQQIVTEKLNRLAPDKLAEVIDFIDSITQKEQSRQQAERSRLIAQYAEENAQSESDFDSDLDQAGIENLSAIDKTNQ